MARMLQIKYFRKKKISGLTGDFFIFLIEDWAAEAARTYNKQEVTIIISR